MSPRRPALRLAAACSLCLAGAAQAQPRAATPRVAHADAYEATVLRVDDGRLLADLARAPHVHPGAVYAVCRPVRVRHPVTGRFLDDRYPIASAVVIHAGDTLAMLRVSELPLQPPAVGDILVPEEAPQPPPEPPPPPLRPLRAPPADGRAPDPMIDRDERAVLEAWTATLGLPPARRAQVWRDFAASHAGSRYVPHAQAEAAAWGRLDATPAMTGLPPPPAQAPRPRPPLDGASAPARLTEGDPAELVLQVADGGRFTHAQVQYRPRGERGYETLTAYPARHGFVLVRVPQAVVRAPGFEYFVELVGRDGRAVPVVGEAGAPRGVEVVEAARPPRSREGMQRIDLRFDLADVGTRANARGVVRAQRFTLIEGDFLQRLGDGVLYGYRVGFGFYDGEGVALDAFDSDAPTRRSSVTYGYHELELAPGGIVHLIGRAQIGVTGGGLAPGAQLRVRIGRERGTNIVVGGDVLGDVGQRAFFVFAVHPHPRVPLLAEGEVFNQSVAGGDPMFRVVAQAGWRPTAWLALAARGSYQLRNIQNGGFGFGLSSTFDW